MRGAAFCAFCAAIVAVAVGQSNKRIDYMRSLSNFSRVDHCGDAPLNFVKICFNETTAALCYNRQYIHTELCAGSRPFCVEGECVYNLEGEFRCPTQFGYFPSPTSCNAFYICSEQRPYLYECFDNSVYDPVLKTCVKQSSSKPCYRFNCAGKHLKFASYPGDRTIYTLCVKNQAVAVKLCQKDTWMNDATQECDPYFKQEGNIEL
ncbi:hypothetical protein AAG570_006148 [Ranatra chinensis]|uniref:Chitin-binding type-2 domain-containing protein n=1 Tax=Ranatra chinensis TaxID=642074 RepID=A0ABD0YIW9_9HEMI